LNIYNDEKPDNPQTAKNVVRTSLQTIQKQVSKLTRLISELLDLSKIESGRLDLKKTEFNLEELVEEAVQEARLVTSQHAIVFRSDFDGTIVADRDRIGQVMSNLLLNAIKYSPDANLVEVNLKSNSKFVSIDIRDHGIGIDKTEHKKIFERFYRVEGKEEQTYPGFGIGLFIAHEIVQRHNGTITVRSEKKKGSTFTVTLLLAPENKF
jgi:two-component system CheB/CheR fusion protein